MSYALPNREKYETCVVCGVASPREEARGGSS